MATEFHKIAKKLMSYTRKHASLTKILVTWGSLMVAAG
jgi:hypothetical protein